MAIFEKVIPSIWDTGDMKNVGLGDLDLVPTDRNISSPIAF